MTKFEIKINYNLKYYKKKINHNLNKTTIYYIYIKTKPKKKMEKTAKIYVAGHRGLVGSAIMRCLKSKGYTNIITRTHEELDLINQAKVNEFFQKEKPEYVFLAAAHVGGILGNATSKADFIYRNMMIGFNVVNAAKENGVKKLMNLGSTCIYPKNAQQPMV